MVATEMVRSDLLFDEEQPLVANQVVGIVVEPLEGAGLVGADVGVEVVEAQPLVGGELIRGIADPPDRGGELADREVVRSVESLDGVVLAPTL